MKLNKSGFFLYTLIKSLPPLIQLLLACALGLFLAIMPLYIEMSAPFSQSCFEYFPTLEINTLMVIDEIAQAEERYHLKSGAFTTYRLSSLNLKKMEDILGGINLIKVLSDKYIFSVNPGTKNSVTYTAVMIHECQDKYFHYAGGITFNQNHYINVQCRSERFGSKAQVEIVALVPKCRYGNEID